MDNVFQCLWVVAEDGYRIERIPEKSGDGLLTTHPERGVIRPISNKLRLYDPMLPPPEGEPLLFRTFADLDETEDAVIEFANRFGMLTIPVESESKDEGLELWFSWIRNMRHQINLAEAGVYRSEEWSRASGPWGISTKNAVELALTRDGKNNSMALKVQLQSLRAAMWVQLGLWISNPSINQRKCGVCGHWFTYGPDTGRRSNANYCRRKCIQAANHQKRKEHGS